MRTRFQVTVLLAATILALPAPGSAQARPVELGIDAGGAFDLSGSNTIVVGLPVQAFRAGFFVSDAVSVESRLALNFIDEDGDNLVTVAAQLGPVVHFSSDRERAQGYLRPFGGINYVDLGTANDAQFALGGALGVKLPIAERLATRLEASYTHGFESGNFTGSDAVAVTVGLSFFTR